VRVLDAEQARAWVTTGTWTKVWRADAFSLDEFEACRTGRSVTVRRHGRVERYRPDWFQEWFGGTKEAAIELAVAQHLRVFDCDDNLDLPHLIPRWLREYEAAKALASLYQLRERLAEGKDVESRSR
jgi:hypothetical protein